MCRCRGPDIGISPIFFGWETISRSVSMPSDLVSKLGGFMPKVFVRIFVVLIAFVVTQSMLIAQLPNPYGAPVSLDTAKKAAALAIAEARKNSWTMAVSVVDIAGDLVYFEKMDGTQTGSVTVSIEKARTAALFKRP